MEGIVQHIYNADAGSIYFVADNTVVVKPLVTVGPPELGANGFVFFPEGAGLLIEGINIVLPYQYGQGTIDPILAKLTWANETATESGDLIEFGDSGELRIPEFNNYIELNNYINFPGVEGTGLWKIEAELSGQVNQINGPDVLNDEELDVKIFLKIRTSYSLQA